jgi:hypothetical protein
MIKGYQKLIVPVPLARFSHIATHLFSFMQIAIRKQFLLILDLPNLTSRLAFNKFYGSVALNHDPRAKIQKITEACIVHEIT